MSCLKVASLWKRREKTWKTMNNCVLFPFEHFATFLRINILRAWNPKPKSRIVVVKVAWKSVVLPTVKWQVLQKSQEICCNFGVCKAISVLEIVLQDSVPVLNLESETQSRNMIWGGTSWLALTFRKRNRLNFKACVPRSCANPFLWIAPKIPPLAPGCFESKCPVDPSRLKAEVLCSQFDA